MIPRAPLFPNAIDSRACAGEQLGPSMWTCPRCTSQALGDIVHMTRLIGDSACHCCKVTLRTRGPIRTIGLHIKETNQISSQAIIFIGSRLMQFVKSAPVREELSSFLSAFLQGGIRLQHTFSLPSVHREHLNFGSVSTRSKWALNESAVPSGGRPARVNTIVLRRQVSICR